MDSDFEAYRRERNYRRRQTNTTERPGGRSDVWEELEQKEADELKDQMINAEVDDFFSDATRLAANIVQKVTENREEEVTCQLRAEMEDFLYESIRHATNMIFNLDWQEAQHTTEKTLVPSMRNLDGRELDEFRAEGTAQLSDKHFGQDPFSEDLPQGDPKAEEVPPALEDDPEELVEQVTESEVMGDEEDADDLPLAAVYDPSQEEPDPFAPDSLAEKPAALDHAGDEAQQGDLEQGDDNGEDQGRDFGIPSGSAPLAEDPIAFGLPETHDVETSLDPEFELADNEMLVGPTEPEAPEPPVPEPPVDAGRRDEMIKAALILLVKQGVMTKQQARAAYRAQTAQG